jgi:hypothetical protein
MLGGLAYSNDLTQWLTYEPTDPDHKLAASWHSYNSNSCNTRSCWISQISPVIAKVPLITGEIGENDCADDYIDQLTDWLDTKARVEGDTAIGPEPSNPERAAVRAPSTCSPRPCNSRSS